MDQKNYSISDADPASFYEQRDILNKWHQYSSCDGCLYNFAEKVLAEYFFARTSLCILWKKPAKIPKIKTHKLFVPHGSFKPSFDVQVYY